MKKLTNLRERVALAIAPWLGAPRPAFTHAEPHFTVTVNPSVFTEGTFTGASWTDWLRTNGNAALA